LHASNKVSNNSFSTKMTMYINTFKRLLVFASNSLAYLDYIKFKLSKIGKIIRHCCDSTALTAWILFIGDVDCRHRQIVL
jgi:hypothetical protein